MRFCKIENNKVVNIIKATQAFVDSLVGTYIQDDNAHIGLELVDGVLQDTTPVYIPTFEENKVDKIKVLQDKFQTEYDAYLTNYPEAEVASFSDKKSEAIAYNLDNNAPTPIIDAIISGSRGTKEDYIASVLAKVHFLAVREGEMVKVRDVIKACTTQDELDAIVV